MIVAHCVYTQNLISSSRKVHDFSVQEFIQDACEAGKLGIPYIVTHTGSYKGSSPAQGLERLIESLKSILDRIPPEVTVLLENSASSTNSLGYRLEELAAVFEKLKTRQNIGLCLDTCHMFAAGYDIRKKEVVETVVKEINSTIGMHRLKVIHLNDSKFDIGTFKDRHQHIGKGKIGLVGIKNVLGQKEFSRAVFILETPKDAEEDDAKNLSVVRKVYKQCTS